MEQLFNQSEPSTSFSITMILRDSLGNPTGKTKSFYTDSSDDLYDYWERNKFRPKRKKGAKNKLKKGEKLPDAKQASDILKKMYTNKES